MKPVTARARRPSGIRPGFRQGRRRPVQQVGPSPAFVHGLERLRAFVKREGHARVLYDHKEGAFGLGAWVSRQRRRYREKAMTAEEARLLSRLPAWSWKPLEDDFDRMRDLLREFVRLRGHGRLPRGARFRGANLEAWAVHQRMLRRKGLLDALRAKRLEDVPGWSWSPRDEEFEKGLALLRAFASRHGHAVVPARERRSGFALGVWVAKRRHDFRRGQLSPEQARRLARIPGWTWSPREQRFEIALRRLRRFSARLGHCRVPRLHVENGFPLGQWVTLRRVDFRQGRLSQARRRKLESLPGWTWEARDVRFMEGMAKLRRFHKRHGHVRVPRSDVDDGFQLGAWLSSVRSQYIKGTLAAKKEAQLAALPGWSWNFRAPRRG